MFRERLDCLIFGYRTLKVNSEDIPTVASRLLRAGISTRINNLGEMKIRERDILTVRDALSGIEYEQSELLGLKGKYKSLKHKWAILSAVVVSLIISVLSSQTVWDIRVESDGEVPDALIVEQLREGGFSVGRLWPLINTSEVEAKILKSSENIGWININRRGSVAYISVAKKETHDEAAKNKVKYANIVAKDDCVIEEISVVRGRAAVKVGDAVKKGDVLIFGALPDEFGGGFCQAEGTVIGRISDTVRINVEREYTEKISEGEKIVEVKIKLFDFSANIFKNYGNLTDGCDIIEEINTFSLFGRARLPFSIYKSYINEYSMVKKRYTDAELVRVAASRLNSATEARLMTFDLVKIRTVGDYTDTGYTMSNELTFTTDVGHSVPLEIR